MLGIILHSPPKTREEVNAEIQRVFEGLVTIPGEIERIFFGYLRNWLNREIDEEERAMIKAISEKSYHTEWKNATAKVYEAIRRAIPQAKLAVGNEGMNDALAQLLAPIVIGMLEDSPDDREFEVLDVGAGEGKTTLALLHQISIFEERNGTDFMRRLHFYTLEPGWNNLHKIGTELQKGGFMERINNWTPLGGMFERFMRKSRGGEYDLIMSSAALHHLTDPAYLDTVGRLLRDNGIFAVGDWYTTLFSHPSLLLPTLRTLHPSNSEEEKRESDRKIRRYMNFFGIYKEDLWKEIEQGFTEEQRKANEEMRLYVIKVAEENRLLSREDRESQLRLFEGHRSLADHMKGAKRAGIETERDVLSEKHPGFGRVRYNFRNVNPGSDISSVWAGAKLRKPLALRDSTALLSQHA